MNTKHLGFTLIETLVVVGIVMILLAMIVPAVQSVRERSRRTACQNNLRQMSLAIQGYEAAHTKLPSLYLGTFLNRPRIDFDEFHFHSWQTAILPQIDQSVLFDRINTSLPATDVSNQINVSTSVASFLCPSTSVQNTIVPDIYAFNNGQIPTQISGTAARSDYDAVVGVKFSTKPPGNNSGFRGMKFGVWGLYKHEAFGKMVDVPSPRFRDVTDGLSNTLMIGERAGRPDLYRRGEPVDPYPYDKPKETDHHQAAWGISTHFEWLVFNSSQAINDINGTGLYSFHTGGANVGLADGSVRFFSEGMNQDALNAFATRSEGDTTSND